jgi:hypothetical protein
MKPLSMNYDPAATIPSADCTHADACWQRDSSGACATCAECSCAPGNACLPGEGNFGYRNPANDTVYASRVPKGSVTVDGDLREWSDHDPALIYERVAWAKEDRSLVVFEENFGGRCEPPPW